LAGPRIAPEDLMGLVASTARAPSLHNSQPWRFRLRENAIELRTDPERMIPEADPDGREMFISCGAALYGLRLGLRRLGYMAFVDLMPGSVPPGPAQSAPLARVRPGGRARPGRDELDLISALPHRHTHRGPFGPGRVPERLLHALMEDAAAEGAELILLSEPQASELASLTETARRQQAASPPVQAEERSWARPPATAVLATPGDTPADWLRAGLALHRLLLRAATRWVFASLHSQALESPRRHAQVRDSLGLAGMPQLLLQFGRANTADPIRFDEQDPSGRVAGRAGQRPVLRSVERCRNMARRSWKRWTRPSACGWHRHK
jgi:hypothetical protein